MTGTLLDICLALLIVSAAAVTLVDADRDRVSVPEPDRADATAEMLATTTAAVNYTLARDAASTASGPTASPEADRVAHATLAGHLARSAVRSATLDGAILSPTSADYRRSVRTAIAAAVGSNAQVRASWRPLPGTGLSGEIHVGASPPATTDVAAARFTVPVGSGSNRETLGASGDANRTTAQAAVDVLFPPERIAAAARDDAPAPNLITHRYRRAGTALGVDAVDVYERETPRAANRQLADALAVRADTSAAAASQQSPSDRVGTVTVVVRTWSP